MSIITMIRTINITAPASTRPITSASSSSCSVVVRIGRGERLVAGARVGLLRAGVVGGFNVVGMITTASVLSLVVMSDVADRDEMFLDVAVDVTDAVDTSAKSFICVTNAHSSVNGKLNCNRLTSHFCQSAS